MAAKTCAKSFASCITSPFVNSCNRQRRWVFMLKHVLLSTRQVTTGACNQTQCANAVRAGHSCHSHCGNTYSTYHSPFVDNMIRKFLGSASVNAINFTDHGQLSYSTPLHIFDSRKGVREANFPNNHFSMQTNWRGDHGLA